MRWLRRDVLREALNARAPLQGARPSVHAVASAARTPGAAPAPGRSFDDWWAEGQARGWVSEPFCAMHHIEPMSPDERERWEAGFDGCTPGTVRVWPLAGRDEGGHGG